ILESASDAFVAIDRQGTITAWNRQAEAIFGWPRDEMLGRRLVDTIIPPSYREAHTEGMRHLHATGEQKVLGQRLELSALRRDGSEFPVELTIWAAGSAPLSFNAFIRDITEKRRAEELRGLLVAIVESTDDTVIAYSLDGTVQSWNAGAESLYGYPAEEMIGRAFTEIVPDDLLAEAERNLATVARGEKIRDFETRRKTESGQMVDVSITISPILDPSGKVIGLSSIGRDITKRKRAEQVLKRAFEHEREMVQKLQQVDQIKSNFVSSVSHELRTPLTSIVGYLELLLEEEDGAFTGAQQEMIGIIDRNSRRLLELIEDVLTLSRIESGKFEISPSRLELKSLVDEVSRAVLPMLTSRSLEFAVELGDVKQVMADASQLERVLLNLLTNAIKFTPDGGRITVSAHREGAMVAVSVADTGIGIAHEDQAKLFDYFYRASAAQAMAIPGTGLGLAIVKNIVEKHGGTVRVESEPGAGTTFTFTVPSGRPVEMPAPEEENVDRSSKGGD
ncbi:MAG: PAS domain-containing sensor histidine kinase, partial [Actinomycetota bacterium]